MERVTREDLRHHLRVTVHSESSNKNGARGVNTQPLLLPSLPRYFHWPNLTGGQRARALLKPTILKVESPPGEEGRLEKEAQGAGDEQKTSSTTC